MSAVKFQSCLGVMASLGLIGKSNFSKYPATRGLCGVLDFKGNRVVSKSINWYYQYYNREIMSNYFSGFS
jgi:hypothetical protein